jgi:hypothetical protein
MPESKSGGLDSIVENEFLGESDTTGAIKEMFRDGIEEDTNKRIIDQKSDLSDFQIPNLAVCDFLCYLGLFEHLDVLTHSIKRLNVSRNRKGRVEMVDVARGMSERKSGSGFLNKFFGGKNQ